MITKCGICGVEAKGMEEKQLLFGQLKGHMEIICTACRNERVRQQRVNKEHEFRDRIINIESPSRTRVQLDAKRLMEAFEASEKAKDRKDLEEFIGL